MLNAGESSQARWSVTGSWCVAMAEKKSVSQPYRQVFEQNPLPMWMVDEATLRFLDVNAAAVALFGYSRAEFRRLRLTDLRAGEELPLAAERTGVSKDGPQYWQYRLKDGRMRDMQVAARRLRLDSKEVELAVLTDVTERRLLEEQLRQSQKMEAVGMPAGDPNHTSVEQIMKAADRAAALTRQLLAFSRRQAVQPKVLDLNALISSMGVMLQRLIGEDVELRLVLGPDLGRVNADPGQMEQVIMNLVVNSRDAMPRGGVLTIATANAELDERSGSTHMAVKPGAYVSLSVTDTGSGMDAETRARLFEPFFTTKGSGKGTGLGLSTVLGIVKRSGGNLEVASEPGQGTRVAVYLPRIDQPAVVEAEKAHPRARHGWETILIVEDEEMVRALVRQTLERAGYRILEAAEPNTARNLCNTYTGQVHLLITDVVLPKQGGRELAQALMRLRPGMKVLFMSGYAHEGLPEGWDEAGWPFLQKPFTPSVLLHKVREVLEGGNGVLRQQAGG